MEVEILGLFKMLVGAIGGSGLTYYYNWNKDKIQPILISIKTEKIFTKILSDFDTRILLKSEKLLNSNLEQQIELDNLFISNVVLTNSGNKSISNFEFGIKSEDGAKFLYAELSSNNEGYRDIKQLSDVSPFKPSENIMFSSNPFNRKDEIYLKLYLISDKDVVKDLVPKSYQEINWIYNKKSFLDYIRYNFKYSMPFFVGFLFAYDYRFNSLDYFKQKILLLGFLYVGIISLIFDYFIKYIEKSSKHK